MAKLLYGSAAKCGEPECWTPLVKLESGQRTLNSRIAHMRASSPSGPRADPYMTCDEVNDFDNLIVLCLFHAVHVDDHEAEYPIELLEEWKARQLVDGEALDTRARLTEEELREAVSAVVPSEVSTGALVELAKAVRAIRAIAERSRVEPGVVCQRRLTRIAQLNSGPRPWNAETGELLQVQLAQVEEDIFRRQVVDALQMTVAEIEPAADRVREAGAGAAVAFKASPATQAWLERSVAHVVERATQWPADLDAVPTAALDTALAELDRVVEGYQRLAAGDEVDVPEPPEPEPPPEPGPVQRIIDTYTPLVEAAGAHLRVDHLPYDSELHQALVASAGVLASLPTSMELMKTGTTLMQNAGSAAAVCRNASNEEFLEAVATARALMPEGAGSEHLRALRLQADEAGRADRVEVIDAAISELGSAVLDALVAREFWERNTWHAKAAVALAVHRVGEDATRERIEAAIGQDDLVVPILVSCASVIDRLESGTMTYVETRRVYSQHEGIPSWLPTDALAAAVRHHWPGLPELRNGFSDHIKDDVERLAAEFISICAAR